MDQSQKLAVMMLRFIGGAIALLGIAGPLYAIIAYLFVGTKLPGERWIASVVWTIAGVLLVVFSKQIGRLLGRGLD